MRRWFRWQPVPGTTTTAAASENSETFHLVKCKKIFFYKITFNSFWIWEARETLSFWPDWVIFERSWQNIILTFRITFKTNIPYNEWIVVASFWATFERNRLLFLTTSVALNSLPIRSRIDTMRWWCCSRAPRWRRRPRTRCQCLRDRRRPGSKLQWSPS